MSGPSVQLSRPPLSWFAIPPDPEPMPLVPEVSYTLKAPFQIDPQFYHDVLNPKVPLTFAAAYIVLMVFLNRLNRRRGGKPWPIAKTSLFHYFVLLHNILLTVYSAITCVAMIRAIDVSWVGLLGEHGLAGAVDSVCKMNGPRGFGDAITYDTNSHAWNSKNPLIHLGLESPLPDSTDVGRIWNEGLAFWGWLFYLSKFYEIVDTLIISAKGKRSSTLQRYHHAGAMLSMWAGMRYMSSPIWMFVLVNSAIHTLMYTYYTAALLNIRVPKSIKRLLTTMQILQFLWGMIFATAHLFISYSAPASIPYTIADHISAAPSSASSAIHSASSAASVLLSTASLSSLASVASHVVQPWLAKAGLLAGNAPGVAFNVRNNEGARVGLAQNVRFPEPAPIRYRTEYQTSRCIDTSGQAFAIWLNVLYLVPLAALFTRFFVQTYLSRPTQAQKARGQVKRQFSDSANDAARRTSDAVESLGKSLEDSMDSAVDDTEARAAELRKDLAAQGKKLKNEATREGRKAADVAGAQGRKMKDEAAREGSALKDTATSQGKKIQEEAAREGRWIADTAGTQGRKIKDEAIREGTALKDAAASQGKTIKDEAASQGKTIKDEGRKVNDAAANKAAQVKESAQQSTSSSHNGTSTASSHTNTSTSTQSTSTSNNNVSSLRIVNGDSSQSEETARLNAAQELREFVERVKSENAAVEGVDTDLLEDAKIQPLRPQK